MRCLIPARLIKFSALACAFACVCGNPARAAVNFDGDVPASPAGDYNDDGAVNAADYTVWRNNLPPQGNPASVAGTPAVPEQTALAIVLIGWCLCYSVVRVPQSEIHKSQLEFLQGQLP